MKTRRGICGSEIHVCRHGVCVEHVNVVDEVTDIAAGLSNYVMYYAECVLCLYIIYL